jgi:Predicted hydrolase (metallo-beta-lactamase superfamily)
MLKLRVVQAHEGDSLLLLYGTTEKPRALLCDGGPKGTYDPYLKRSLNSLGTDVLDAVILSHVDNDHVLGLLDFLAEIRDQKAAHTSSKVAVSELWLNEFSNTVDSSGVITQRLRRLAQRLASQNLTMRLAAETLEGVREGHNLAVLALQLGIPVNKVLNGVQFVAPGIAPFTFHGLEVHVVGPTRSNLDELAKEWRKWLDHQEDLVGKGKLKLAAMADKSIPNLSSIQLLIKADGKTILLTGDGRGDHLLQALEEASLLTEAGTFEVDLLKVPHHGSDRNVTRRFFEQVRARTYVVSADGKNGNPDLPTLQWIVESREADADPITIVVTNRTPTVGKLLQSFPQSEHGYTLLIREEGDAFIEVEVA